MRNRRLRERVPKPADSLGQVVAPSPSDAPADAAPADAEHPASVEQLKQTIVAMRQQMESLQWEHQRSAQEALAVALDEIAQLKRTIVAMREELELKGKK